MIAALLTFSKVIAWFALVAGAIATAVCVKAWNEEYSQNAADAIGCMALAAFAVAAVAFAWIASTWGVSV